MSVSPHDENGDRRCTRCGKSVEDAPYQYWVFCSCRSCMLDADGRFRDCGTYRKWRYFPRWHMTQHPELPSQKRERMKHLRTSENNSAPGENADTDSLAGPEENADE